MPATVMLAVTRGALRGRTFEFAERTTCILGRARDCEPRLPDDDSHRTVSRHHCLLDINPPDIRIRDFGSLNGTYLNGAKIGQRAAYQSPEEAAGAMFPEHDLGDGDEVRLGDTVFRVSVVTAAYCDDCENEIPEHERNPGDDRCAACRAAAVRKPANPTPILVPSRCAACGRDVSSAAKPHTGGDLCARCAGNPELVLDFLFQLANSGDHDLSAIRGYRVRRELGRGGMGAVYLARDDATGRDIALKVMLPQVAVHRDARTRFLREIDVTKGLRHRHIATLHDAGTSHGTFFLTLEYCPGGSLDQLVAQRDGRLSVYEAVRIAGQVLDGLGHAHQRKIVHRDLSPQNILLQDETAEVAKITDFGLAKAFDQAGLSGLTRTGTMAGKPVFMPRQQVINFKHTQPDVDVWALAACLYWTLTGTYPRDFPARKDPWQVVLQTGAVPIRERNRNLPAGLADVIDHALRDQPTIGFSSAAELRDAIENSL